MLVIDEPITLQEINDAREMIGIESPGAPVRVQHPYQMTPGLYLVIPMDCPNAADIFIGPDLYVLKSQVIQQWYFCVLLEKRSR